MSKIIGLTNENFKEKLIEYCKKIDYSSINNIISGMHIRIQKVIDNNGGRTKIFFDRKYDQ